MALPRPSRGFHVRHSSWRNVDSNDVARAFDELQEKLYRKNILDTGKRVDGRGVKDLRTITTDSGMVPRVHGSAVFNRGETQALVIATLGTSKDVQEIDGLTGGATNKSFILHYNFPPCSRPCLHHIGPTHAQHPRPYQAQQHPQMPRQQ